MIGPLLAQHGQSATNAAHNDIKPAAMPLAGWEDRVQ